MKETIREFIQYWEKNPLIVDKEDDVNLSNFEELLVSIKEVADTHGVSININNLLNEIYEEEW